MRADGPILIHAITKKGKGFAPAERLRVTNITAPSKFNVR